MAFSDLSFVERVQLQRIEVEMAHTRGRDVPEDCGKTFVVDRRVYNLRRLPPEERHRRAQNAARARFHANHPARPQQLLILFLDGTDQAHG